ncbi:alpha/beta hydrolase [Nocardioides mangrovi]|uniref:Acyl-CoA:diacylglycerol acyltransferase n=1 Tax=Nocardioides mangrovi TaxID=2874580 RepID=A0ABS7UI51_9ACTN|nr:alpha/beta fold hydrolase [Nocardioides mangrovi]MBZ5740346.1 esterase family protein [Nocardioides mangrovi]
MPSRRALLLGGAGVVVAGAVGAATGVEQGWLPGRPWAQAHLGLNGDDGVIPADVEPVLGLTRSFRSEAMAGARVPYTLLQPFSRRPLPVVVALHGLGQHHDTVVGELGLGAYLAQAIQDGVRPFAIAVPEGGTSYWHPHGEGDTGDMVTDDLLPELARRGLDVSRVGLMGWSMGGYGALRLGGVLGPDRVAAVVAASPAIWTDPADASSSGFASAEEYEHYTVVGHQDDLDGIAVRVDVGTGDPFYRDVQDYVEAFPAGADVTSTFEPGAHDAGYWRRMLPAELDFLGRGVGSQA